ncbi:MAG: hypothetical protein WCL32_01085 [Planctomycetota bacterium]
MVERPRLCFGPWREIVCNGLASPVRVIRDLNADLAIGQVRPSAAATQPWWRFWSPLHGLEVCETDDLALLLTLRPSRLSKGLWILRDCDDNEVGKLRGDELLDPWSQPFARRFALGGDAWQMRELDGRAYATWSMSPEGDILAFHDQELTNPFVRMLVLGSFLLMRKPS